MEEAKKDEFSHKPDGTPRNPYVSGVLKHFRYGHLPTYLQETSMRCASLALRMADSLPENPDLTCGLRDLLSAKDNFVRSQL